MAEQFQAMFRLSFYLVHKLCTWKISQVGKYQSQLSTSSASRTGTWIYITDITLSLEILEEFSRNFQVCCFPSA